MAVSTSSTLRYGTVTPLPSASNCRRASSLRSPYAGSRQVAIALPDISQGRLGRLVDVLMTLDGVAGLDEPPDLLGRSDRRDGLALRHLPQRLPQHPEPVLRDQSG